MFSDDGNFLSKHLQINNNVHLCVLLSWLLSFIGKNIVIFTNAT